MYIRTRIQSRKAPVMSKLARMSEVEASKYGPYGKNDNPCVVECGGKRTNWKSRRAAIFFYTVAAKMCEGSEAERYSRIANALSEGANVANDGTPVIRPLNEPLPQDPMLTLTALKMKRDNLARMMDDAREKGMYDAAQRHADLWNAVSIEIIKLTKAMREKGLLPPLAIIPNKCYNMRRCERQGEAWCVSQSRPTRKKRSKDNEEAENQNHQKGHSDDA